MKEEPRTTVRRAPQEIKAQAEERSFIPTGKDLSLNCKKTGGERHNAVMFIDSVDGR